MKSRVFLFVGIILIIVGIIISQSDARVTVNRQLVSKSEGAKYLNYVGGGLGGLGLIFVIIGIAGAFKGSKQKKRNLYIMQNGVETQGTITFVDKNWSILVNKNPIYSIVEYNYTDKNGVPYTRRVNNINSEIVIRKQFQVGSKIPIKYAAENPSESVIVLSM